MESSSIVSSEKGLRKGAWAEEEDLLLRKCIMKYGEGKWRQVPIRAGLNRCRKSCRLRWLNYLQPNIKRGEFKPDEVDLIVRMHKLLGNRWSLIAGRLPGRTANDIKNYYNTRLKKTCFSKYNPEKGQQVLVTKKSGHDNNVHQGGQAHEHRQILKRRRPCPKISTIDDIVDKHMPTHVLKPQPRTFKKYQWNMNKVATPIEMNNNNITTTPSTRFPNNSQVVNQNITKCLPLLVGNHHGKFSNDQQSHDNSCHWLKSILFGETEEEEDSISKKKKKKPKKKKRVTPNNNTSLIESNITKGVEEGMTKHTNDGNDDQHAYYCSFDADKGLEEGGNSDDHGNFWNSYLDDNLWRMLGEEQEQYLMI